MDSVPGMIAFVRNSDWATILPLAAIVRDRGDPELILNPIIDAQFETNIYLVHLTQFPLSPAAHEFVKAMRKETTRARELFSSDFRVRNAAGRPGVKTAKSAR